MADVARYWGHGFARPPCRVGASNAARLANRFGGGCSASTDLAGTERLFYISRVPDGPTIQDFAALVGCNFTVAAGELPSLRLEMVAGLGEQMIPGGREPFSLTFIGPATPVFPQGTYHLANENLGPLDVFLVPIASDERGTAYEAIFA